MVSAVKLCISSFRHTDLSIELQLLKRWSTMPFHSQSTKVCINIFILIDHNNNKLLKTRKTTINYFKINTIQSESFKLYLVNFPMTTLHCYVDYDAKLPYQINHKQPATKMNISSTTSLQRHQPPSCSL